MLRIAICDDEPICLKQTTQSLHAYFRAQPSIQGEVTPFESGEALLSHVRACAGFDLYLLDILMAGSDGIEIGRRLRKLGQTGEIIYLTNSNGFAADSYDVHAFFYLLKPVQEGKLFSVLDRAIMRLERRRISSVLVSTQDGSRRLILEDIRYVERVGRIMRYNCVEGVVDSLSIRVSFREAVAPLLKDSRFYLCGASFVLNFQHVTGVTGQIAIFGDGAHVALPRAVAADFKRAWGCYWLLNSRQGE